MIGHFPAPPVAPTPTVPVISAGAHEILFWPPYGTYWPPPGRSARPTQATIAQGCGLAGRPGIDAYVQWGAEYRPLPADCFENAPRVAFQIGDWNTAGRLLRLLLEREFPIFCDGPGAVRLTDLGHTRVVAHVPFGWDAAAWPITDPGTQRPIDVLFVGSRNSAIHRRREHVVRELEALGSRWNVVSRTWLPPRAYRELAVRARAMLNFSVRGEANLRTFEAIGSGCLLLSEQGNVSVQTLFEDGREYATYEPGRLKDTVAAVLSDEVTRRLTVRRAQRRLPQFAFDQLAVEFILQNEKHLTAKTSPPRDPYDFIERQWLLTSDAACFEDISIFERRRAEAAYARDVLTQSHVEEPSTAEASAPCRTMADRLREVERQALRGVAQTSSGTDGLEIGPLDLIPVPDFGSWRMSLEQALLESSDAVAAATAWIAARHTWLANVPMASVPTS